LSVYNSNYFLNAVVLKRKQTLCQNISLEVVFNIINVYT
jgi:hypothetical protein